MSIGWGPDLPGPEMRWYEVVITTLVVLIAAFVFTAIAIELDTGKPAKISVQEWWGR